MLKYFNLEYYPNFDLYGIDLQSLVETLPCFKTWSKLTKLPNMRDFDIDENLISTKSCWYYDLNEINKIKLTRQNVSVLHTNIRSLSKHF